jgi:hypothetical protein
VKDRKHKLISSFGLSSFVYFIIGLILFWTKKWHVLKYFWFRFPDTILPYISFFLFFSLLYDLLGKIEFIRNRALLKKSVPVVFLLTSIVLIGLSTGKFIGSVKPIIADTEYFYLKDTEVEMKEVMLWIRNSTDAASVFLVNPFIDNFYVGAERGAFIILKAGPLTEEKYAEWYERVKLCNGNKELTQYGWDNKSEIDKHFYALSEEELHRIGAEYGLDYYIGLENRALQLAAAYNNRRYAVYSLR